MFSQDREERESTRRIADALRRVYDDVPENNGEPAFDDLLRRLGEADRKPHAERQKESTS